MNIAVFHKQALSLIQSGDWDGAHHLVQDHSDPISCRIHGLLHRIEDDINNAAYWYRQAGLTLPLNSISEELAVLLSLT